MLCSRGVYMAIAEANTNASICESTAQWQTDLQRQCDAAMFADSTRLACFAGQDDLVSICACVGGRGLAAICKLLAQDFSGWAGCPCSH